MKPCTGFPLTISTHDSTRAIREKHNYKFHIITGFVQLSLNFYTINMVKRKCKHCPIPGCGSKFLVRLADHLTRVHGLSELERKYWLQFAKLQTTNVVRVYVKEAEPKTIFV